MIGGKKHVLVLLDPVEPEHHVATYNPSITWESVYKWRCSACGERFQKRNPSPSCPIDMILQIQKIADELTYGGVSSMSLDETPTWSHMLDQTLLKRLRWEKFVRERYIAAWKHWRTFQIEKGVPSDAHEEKNERPGPRPDPELHDEHSAADDEAGDPGDLRSPRGPRHLGTLRRRS